MIGFLLSSSSTFLSQCAYNISFLNNNNWLSITALVVVMSLMISAMAYGLSGLFPGNTRERVRGVVKYEYIQGIFSIILIIVLFTLSFSACSIGSALVGTAAAPLNYQDPFQFASYYIGNLMFAKGIALVTGLFSAGTVLMVDATLVNFFVSEIGQAVPIRNSGTGLKIAITGTDEPATVIYEYSYVLNTVLAPLVVVSFGLLFVIFLSLNVIEALALTLVIPVAIIMRSLAFTGPKLREVSNGLVAIAIAFYFVFPLTLAMNYYVVNWTYCINGGSCNPYATPYLNPGYQLNNLPINQLFTNPEYASTASISGIGALINVWTNFYSFQAQGSGGFLAAVSEIFQGLVSVPSLLNNFVMETAQYLFQAIFLIALDVGITIGFAVGLHKSLEAMGQIFGIGPFWGS
ncbi:MAG TPA: hypothetical protein VL945_00510 [Candidatus Saccharimonadales bacterium]|nr:hypothetical protein [Candidatus Saccharimonadales bacterium]